ncbi:glycine-rich family protein [Tripterygium wilfordii]|uniref:Glycine-rich family protein n=1 Tax=Tripterygium wilfordii TaxID=458696 RepID=A0A7J7D8T5_TRIWF|nr:uncharacterized protein LOC120004970 [Tripterygium wilfordii]KAF5742757.1 glycine-rich family protein [Tripterygium wilfordii]
MSSIQTNLCKPCPYTLSARISRSSCLFPTRVVLPIRAYDPLKCSLKLFSMSHHRMPMLKCRQGTTICLLSGKDKSEGENQGSPSNALDKAMGSFKGKSVEDVLRQQIEKQEFYDDGGSGKIPPRGRRGGGDGNGSEGSGDEGLAGVVDETLQVILATLGFIFLYIYIITGEELTRLGKDYIKYIFRGGKSVRLKRAMDKWSGFWTMLYDKKEDKYWLEKEILRTNTWYDGPEKYRRVISSALESDSSLESDSDE